MKFNKPLYYCTECKKVISSLDQLLFVDGNSSKGFCCEGCIEDFYRPFISHFSIMESQLRKSLNLEFEKIDTQYDEKQLAELILASPDEVIEIGNELGESFFSLIKKIDQFFAVVVCLMNEKEATYIFLLVKTKSKKLIDYFRNKSSTKSNPEIKDEMSEEDYNFLQNLESKKSRILADLLLKKKDNDIPFEDFTKYESSFEQCLNDPDEVFETKDIEGDIFFTYIKSFNTSGENYFYIILCLKRPDSENENEISVFPALAFPTKDFDLYNEFSIGIRISGKLRN